MKKIVFLVSGDGGTLKFLYHAINFLNLNFQIVGVIADRECQSLQFAEKENIFSLKIKYTKENTEELQKQLFFLNPDLIITNIHKIIDEKTLGIWENKFINVHYSLLPGFAGLIGMDTVKKAKDQNVKFIGSTCHLVNKEVDSGMILQQGCFSVDWENDNFVIDTVFKTACICLLEAIDQSQNKSNEFVVLNNFKVQFSPPISSNTDVFTNEFWNLIRNS
ncbi:formyltransferase family protein [Flavobacterium poyangense]|uniref:formyltransferase family protein n=1 Tax=Flavobacterium poyangense TaxID=2204302 RepID=UPI00141DA404|nr:formyltransferase family protein [Flavobacterium sp. JXAS1]